ncbi:MAG: M20/M25/M40 family metallo-hydrolase [Acidobacteria bacterium]|nr:M20/M25/M40 family metallo-hydrolase [Acidobacteriota bacterium]
MKGLGLMHVAFVGGVMAALGAAQSPTVAIPAAAIERHVTALAADDLRGRANGTPELERAADYVTAAFRETGLTGGGDAGGFRQQFQAPVRLEPSATSTVVITRDDQHDTLRLGHDFHPLSFLEHAPTPDVLEADDAPVVFAGYGISAPALAYDDFAGVDVRGAAVVVLTHEPRELDPRSPFAGTALTPAAAIAAKAREVRERGGVALLIVEDPTHAEDRAMRSSWWDDPQADAMGIPVLRVSREAVARTLPGLALGEEAAAIDRTLRPRSRALPGITLSYDEQRARFTAPLVNIVGVLPGANATRAGDAIVIGAHYDHVGFGGEYSEAPEAAGDIHNGADDNASGTAVLIEVAREAVRQRARIRRTLVFVAFAGEELGLLGSAHYVEHPVRPLHRTIAMINLDMVGRARGRVLIGTFGRSTRVGLLPSRLRTQTRLSVQDFSGGYGVQQSDVAPFVAAGVPALAFFTGFHADYHRPTDDAARVDAAGAAEIARLALAAAMELAR